MTLFKRFETLDRRWIFLALLLAVLYPLLRPIGTPIQYTSNTRQFIDVIDGLQPGDTILMSFDYGGGLAAEVDPQARIVLAHAFSRDLRVVAVAFLDLGLAYAQELVAQWESEGKVYGEDLVLLGYAAGAETAISAFSQDIQATFPRDVRGQPLSAYPLTRGMTDVNAFDLVVEFATGVPGPPEWIRQVQARYDVPLACAVTSVAGPQTEPYLQSRQLVALLNNGLKSAAEYETLVGMPGPTAAAMDAQSLGHLLIVVLIVLNNVAYLSSKSGRKR